MTEEHKRKISESHIKSKLHKGIKLSENHKNKIRNSMIGKPLSINFKNTGRTHFKKGSISFMKGKHHTEESKEKSRQSHLGQQGYWLGKKRPNMIKLKQDALKGKTGKDALNWKGGTSRGYFKKIVCQRDNYTCQICGLKDEEIIEVDHIRPEAIAPELFSELANLICICPNCHRRKTNRDLKIIKDFKNQVS